MRTGSAVSRCALTFSNSATWRCASLSPLLATRLTRSRLFSTDSRSARASSVLIVSMSAAGSMEFDTWVTFSSSKQRTTWAMASHSRILARNWLPSPSPLEAPATSPAMSVNSTVVGITFSGFTNSASLSRRVSGIETMPELGSMVQKGKFSAAIPASVRALKRVDLPTLGSPTIPHLTDMFA